MNRLTNMLRQLRYPRALRIQTPELPLPVITRTDLEMLMSLARGDDPNGGGDVGAMAKIATSIWRLEKQAKKLGNSEEDAAVNNRLKIVMNTLTKQGVEIRDYTGTPFDEDEIWDDVVGAGDQAGPVVIAGMREPRVLLNNRLIQRGTPILGTQ